VAGAEGAQVIVVVATDERQAGIVHRVASRMVELHPDLESRVQQYADALTVPTRGASFQVLPAVPKRLEGLDYTLAIVDEAGRVDTEVFEVVTLATGKQKASMVLAIGTPGPELAATALADFLAIDGLEACLPPKMREASFRRARLCQLTDQLEAAWLPPSAWAACADVNQPVVDGAEVVLAFDGSFNGDTTVLVVASVAERPHVDLVELWEPAGGQVPIVDVEQAIRKAYRRWRVLEIAADPFRWARSLHCWTAKGCRSWSTRSHPGA
jgi:phage terminase large subunit-like protein